MTDQDYQNKSAEILKQGRNAVYLSMGVTGAGFVLGLLYGVSKGKGFLTNIGFSIIGGLVAGVPALYYSRVKISNMVEQVQKLNAQYEAEKNQNMTAEQKRKADEATKKINAQLAMEASQNSTGMRLK